MGTINPILFNEKFYMMNPNVLTNAILTFYVGGFCGYRPEELVNLGIDRETSEMMKFIYKTAVDMAKEGEYDVSTAMHIGICYYQNYVQVRNWRKTKQVYSFDSDMLNELIRTDIKGITIPQDVFDYLPNQCVYLDFSANPEIINKIGADGCIAQVNAVTLQGKSSHQNSVVLMSFFKNNEPSYKIATILPNEGNYEMSIEEILHMAENISNPNERKSQTASMDITGISEDERPEGYEPELQPLLVLQCLLYLCSYEPDIYETASSKMQYRTAKKNKKTRNNEMPNREFKVGERFGEAFRRWTKGMLGQGNEHTATGKHVKPHIRKAHWHRFWVGKRGSEERRLVLKWVSECFCGITEDETENKLDTVKHKVKSARNK